ncbi:OmpA family protein [Frateuria defendens]|uniref:OmpA family protein n=1 Tax=Frateuria defendens TaxID=2219559 RepID=UPI00066FDFC9|nr:OmpA family protein [Frateuria defendens]
MRLQLTLLTSACYVLTSCATLDQAGAKHGAEIGCATGAVLGGVLGNIIGQKSGNRTIGTATGAAVGTALGCYVGNHWQKRQQALQELAAREHLSIETEPLSARTSAWATTGQPRRPATAADSQAGLVANVQNSGMFDSDSSRFTPDGLRQAHELARIYRSDPPTSGGSPLPRHVLLVVGHTDATGQPAHNQELSERRARAMGEVLVAEGVDPHEVYFQGAGASRPIADNTTEEGRARNRRVEIVELASNDLLLQRIRLEQANPRYLAHGTVPAVPPPAHSEHRASITYDTNPPSVATTSAPAMRAGGRTMTSQAQPARAGQEKPGFVDFGGAPASSQPWDLAALLKPQHSGFSLISSAFASDTPMRSCEADQPRISGSVRNLASGKTLEEYTTRDFLPGMNGRAWAGLVNGNLVTLSPVALLRDDAAVAKDPQAFVTPDYAKGHRKVTATLPAVANAYEGEDNVLYRVFVQDRDAPLRCVDVVLPKAGGIAPGGKLYYGHDGQTYVADFTPRRS